MSTSGSDAAQLQEDRSIAVMEGSAGTTSSSASGIVENDQSNVSPNVLECFICMEPPTDPVAASCGHVFCWPCMHQWLQNRPKPCPVCRCILRRDLNIIPLYGGGSGAAVGPSSAAASDSIIPPRPRNPLLVNATANPASPGFVLTPSSVLIAYERMLIELSETLGVERGRVDYMALERINLEVEVNDLEQRNADLRRQVQDRDWQLFVERNEMMQSVDRVNDLEQRNLILARLGHESWEREQRHMEKEIQMAEQIASLQRRLDRANSLLSPG